ncbi:MAG TPA: hypothetical protein PLZ09_03360 [Clostridia bacterium]|nr:hypothetical protein [Clostridia bacterium]
MIAKEKFTKIMYILLAVCIVVLFLLIFDTSCTALKANDIDYVDYINKTFVTKDMNSSIKFVDTGKILITNDKKATFYVVLESDKDVVIISDTEQDFAIKFVDESTIYCEKTKKYMYLATTKEKNEIQDIFR